MDLPGLGPQLRLLDLGVEENLLGTDLGLGLGNSLTLILDLMTQRLQLLELFPELLGLGLVLDLELA